MASDIHISISAEPIFQIGNFEITNAMLGSLVVCLGLCVAGIFIGATLKKKGLPNKIQNAIEWYYNLIEQTASDGIGSAKKARPYLGLVLTLFLFIVFSSWLGLIPGILHIGVQVTPDLLYPLFRAPTTDLNATIGLAIIAWLTIQFAGFSAQGFSYLGKFFQFNHGPINFFVGIQELISEFARLISFSFRLFGNIFAGEVLIVVISALTKFSLNNNSFAWLDYIGVPLPAFIILMEVLVAMMQAYVFVSLMSVFIALAAEKTQH
jgi:F-type H+-transporting ATPase subunit a